MSLDNYVDSEKPVKTVEVKQESLSVKDIFARLQVFGLGIVIGLILCIVALWAVSLIGMNYVWTAIVAFVFTLTLLFTFEEVTGLNMSRIKTAILATIFIFFMVILLSSSYESNKSYRNETKVSYHVMSWKSEILTFAGKERLVAKAYLPVGKEYRITVHGSCVNFIKFADIEVLAQEHGTYIFRITSEGSLIFDGTGNQSIVTIEWLE